MRASLRSFVPSSDPVLDRSPLLRKFMKPSIDERLVGRECADCPLASFERGQTRKEGSRAWLHRLSTAFWDIFTLEFRSIWSADPKDIYIYSLICENLPLKASNVPSFFFWDLSDPIFSFFQPGRNPEMCNDFLRQLLLEAVVTPLP